MIDERKVDPRGPPVGVGAVVTVLIPDATLTREVAEQTALRELIEQYNPDFVAVLGVKLTDLGWAVRVELFTAVPRK
jgi:hypothetical protein